MRALHHPWFPFVGPFAVLGAFGGRLTATRLGSGVDGLGLTLLFVTPLVASLLGALLASKRKHWRGLLLAMPLLVPLAGAVNGILIAVLLSFGESLSSEVFFVGIFMGGFCGLFFIPALVWVFLAAVRVGRARAGSLVDAAQKRAPWGAAALCVVATLWAMRIAVGGAPLPGAVRIALEASVVWLFFVLAADLRAFAVGARRARLAQSRATSGEAGAHHGDILDLGVGDETFAEPLGGPATAYRTTDMGIVRLFGSFDLARRELLRLLAIDAVASVVALAMAAKLLA